MYSLAWHSSSLRTVAGVLSNRDSTMLVLSLFYWMLMKKNSLIFVAIIARKIKFE
jgi:hypothetical protein